MDHKLVDLIVLDFCKKKNMPMSEDGNGTCLSPTDVFWNSYKFIKIPTENDKNSYTDSINIKVRTLTGETFELNISPQKDIHDLKEAIEKKNGTPIDQQRLLFAARQLEEFRKIADYNIANGAILHLVLRMRGGGCGFYYDNDTFFDKKFHYDFTKITDVGKVFYRGGEQYYRPVGCKRYAINVDKYDDQEWLGSSNGEGEWPVAYHGTAEPNVGSIVQTGLDLDKCKRFAYGRGIYCTPNHETALEYASTYEFQGKKYKVVFQTRVNPQDILRFKVRENQSRIHDYWLVPSGDHIRPYGLCIFPQ